MENNLCGRKFKQVIFQMTVLYVNYVCLLSFV